MAGGTGIRSRNADVTWLADAVTAAADLAAAALADAVTAAAAPTTVAIAALAALTATALASAGFASHDRGRSPPAPGRAPGAC